MAHHSLLTEATANSDQNRLLSKLPRSLPKSLEIWGLSTGLAHSLRQSIEADPGAGFQQLQGASDPIWNIMADTGLHLHFVDVTADRTPSKTLLHIRRIIA